MFKPSLSIPSSRQTNNDTWLIAKLTQGVRREVDQLVNGRHRKPGAERLVLTEAQRALALLRQVGFAVARGAPQGTVSNQTLRGALRGLEVGRNPTLATMPNWTPLLEEVDQLRDRLHTLPQSRMAPEKPKDLATLDQYLDSRALVDLKPATPHDQLAARALLLKQRFEHLRKKLSADYGQGGLGRFVKSREDELKKMLQAGRWGAPQLAQLQAMDSVVRQAVTLTRHGKLD